MPDPVKAVITVTIGTGKPGSTSRALSWPVPLDVAETFAQGTTRRWGEPTETLMTVPAEPPPGVVTFLPDEATDG